MDETYVLEKRNKIKNMRQAFEDYNKVKEVLKSCNNEDQLRVGVKMANLLDRKYDKEIPTEFWETLENIIGLMRMKCGVEKEPLKEISPMGQEFKRQSAISGVRDLQQLSFDESEDDILKEINIGSQIEGNHLSPKEAKEVATTNVNQISDYYSNPDYCIIAVENKYGDKKTVRVGKELYEKSKEGKEQLLLADMEIFHENLDMNDITQSLRDQLKRKNKNRISKKDIFKKIKELRSKELERRRDTEEEVEESTGSGSAGAYVGPMSREVVKRTFSKNEIPVSANGMTKPIGKLYSFSGRKNESEILEEDELEEATSYADAVGAYDTPGFPPSEFMGTAGKKGKAPVNKGITHTKLAYPGGDFVKIKNKCARYPYCNQSPEAIKISKKPFKDAFYENKIIKKGKLKIKK